VSDTWTCKVSYDHVVSNTTDLPGNTDPNSTDWGIHLRVVALPLGDPIPKYNPPTDFGHIAVTMAINNDGSSTMGLSYQAGTNEINPFFWQISTATPNIFGTNAQFFNGGDIVITKDFAGNLLSATTPIGTISASLSDISANIGQDYNNNQPLRLQGYGLHSTSPTPTFTNPIFAADRTADFHDLIGQKNAVTYQQVPLSAANPGAFYPDHLERFDLVGGTDTLGETQWWTIVQLTSEYQLKWAVTLLNNPQSANVYFYRRSLTVPVTSAADMSRSPEHGSLYASVVYQADASKVKLRTTYDSGNTWVETNVFSDAATTNSNPAIAWCGDRILVVWQKSGTLVQSTSFDLGASWGTPVPLGISGSNARLLVDPHHRIAYYFYIDASSNLQVRRSATYGADFIDAAHLVVSGITAQTIAADFAADGSIIIGYISSGAWTQKRSYDGGLSWS
jgi:hypothetical protein